MAAVTATAAPAVVRTAAELPANKTNKIPENAGIGLQKTPKLPLRGLFDAIYARSGKQACVCRFSCFASSFGSLQAVNRNLTEFAAKQEALAAVCALQKLRASGSSVQVHTAEFGAR